MIFKVLVDCEGPWRPSRGPISPTHMGPWSSPFEGRFGGPLAGPLAGPLGGGRAGCCDEETGDGVDDEEDGHSVKPLSRAVGHRAPIDVIIPRWVGRYTPRGDRP